MAVIAERVTVSPSELPHVELTGPASLDRVLDEMEALSSTSHDARYVVLPTGFDPLDDVLNGGMLPGHLLVVGGSFGVGKTIWGLQFARNVAVSDPHRKALYICYEHERSHLLSRLLCLESAESRSDPDGGLTLRRLGQIMAADDGGTGLIGRLRKMPRYAAMLDAISSYSDRLVLAKASGATTTLEQIREWAEEATADGVRQLLVVVDYLQKVPVGRHLLGPDMEDTTFLTQGLKQMAMDMGIYVVALAASDRQGLQAQRMRFTDLRGSSALQYEADIGLVLNNKYAIVSREHVVYNPAQAEGMRNWVVFTMEKNRAGRNSVDIEFPLDAAHFRIVPKGSFVRERLIDDRVTLQ